MTLNRVELDDEEIRRLAKQIDVAGRSLEGYEYWMEKHEYNHASRTGDRTTVAATSSVSVDSRHTTVDSRYVRYKFSSVVCPTICSSPNANIQLTNSSFSLC
jgi:hypothetical protein